MKNPFSILFLFYVTQSVGTTTFEDFAVKLLKVRNFLELVSKNKCRNSTF
ncbi:hypothetical protein LEP1GSC020_3425 [Leptospira interrogans serovar Grippotyphosa str. 2006006986]|nr:hypothetical protein LEP1GSC080_0160 [Leptospira interrogans str. FPW2026]EKO70738.1 hypothetical protein LEP1GSC069_0060 [Leptospira interrogans serovar Canicola str. Fiocruz LV133]EKO89036.1 hypothetical protein LEP1GSC009_0740 [Leptospira interrogans serovar Grippotyphosa str. Andaman]EKP83696.1 hypothetical protein LEP1GSC020_3425 [Leptospira interrogans serovar Grippotyphosa str. 2006006986]EKR33996.1 hypothetical protein LEP1GSC096_0186 [Leptospira interrogans serovar Hebdomadis str. R